MWFHPLIVVVRMSVRRLMMELVVTMVGRWFSHTGDCDGSRLECGWNDHDSNRMVMVVWVCAHWIVDVEVEGVESRRWQC